ncbi:MAG: hypothetical protein JSV78_06375 [Phycisphaerales bacterium]|nr:MAG: hypothetical protein JSV78_06375 [Phycisphaerales bacterium]
MVIGVQEQAAVAKSTQAGRTREGPHGRWWCAVLVGVWFSLPFSWLLSFGALLPFLLGLFFFALFGLIIGALVFRIAAPGRPYGKGAIVVGTTVIVLVCWCTAFVLESRDFPREMGQKATDATRSIDMTRQQHIEKMAEDVRAYLREEYPPGGLIGYVRWSLTDGRIKKGVLDGPRRTIKRNQVKHWWAIRVVVSIGLLAFGVASMTWPLRLEEDSAGGLPSSGGDGEGLEVLEAGEVILEAVDGIE